MKNPIKILLSFLLFLPLVLLADDISVESFKRLDQDMDARINHPEKDPSGRTCALLKVVNPNTGFVFDTGTVAVVKTKQGTGEIWVYVQPGVKKLTINHPTLGVMRDYYFQMPIEEATVYELRLTTGTVHTYIEQTSSSAYLVVNSDPDGAYVYIGDEFIGNTPLSKKYNLGQTLQYRITRPLYHDEVGEIKLDNTRNEVNAVLKQAYGTIKVTSDPTGATVLLDNDTDPRGTTPLNIDKIASGPHKVLVQYPRYGLKVVDVTVSDGRTVEADARLTANFAQVTINSLPGAVIKVDGEIKGTGTASLEQDAGVCDIEVSLDGHRNQSRQIQILPGEPQTITLEPIPMYGTLAIESVPPGAEIYIDDVKRGLAPEVFNHILAVGHTVRLSKEGCADYTTEVVVRENEETTINGKLSTGESVTIATGQSGDDIYIDGKFAGKSPLTTTISFGKHKAYAIRGDKRSCEKGFEVLIGQQPTVNLAFDGPVEYTVKGVKFNMIPVEGGTFTMGATGKLAKEAYDNETPTHEVTLSDYMIGQTEVTQALWEAIMGNNPSYNKGANFPVEEVRWNDCQEFIIKLNELTGLKFRLPTEAEWEYAAKGGIKAHEYIYSGSDDIDSVAWYRSNSSSKTHPVATKAPNELGIYDMTGNVWEWCSDWKGSYSSSSQTNPTGPASGSYRVFRGGSYYEVPRDCRSSARGSDSPDSRYGYLGFRLALVP